MNRVSHQAMLRTMQMISWLEHRPTHTRGGHVTTSLSTPGQTGHAHKLAHRRPRLDHLKSGTGFPSPTAWRAGHVMVALLHLYATPPTWQPTMHIRRHRPRSATINTYVVVEPDRNYILSTYKQRSWFLGRQYLRPEGPAGRRRHNTMP